MALPADPLLIEGIFQLGIQSAMLKTKPRYSRELTAQLWRIQYARRVPVERQQFKFWRLYLKHYAALMQEALLTQMSPDHVITNPGEVNHLFFGAQVKHRNDSIDLVADGFRQAARIAVPIKAKEIAGLVAAIRYFWDQRKSTEPNSPPEPIMLQTVEANIYAALEEGYYTNHSLLATNIVSDSVAERLRQIIANAAARGATARELAAEIERGIGGPSYSGWRAMRIARTEVNSLMNRVNLEGMEASGVVYSKIWLSMADEAVRDDHREADGQEVPINMPFTVGGMYMQCPGDPAGGPAQVVNCRCFVDWNVPVFTPDGWKTINKISVGDMVLTHKGRFRKVRKTLEPQRYCGSVVTITYTTGYSPRADAKKPRTLQVRVTPEHPVLTQRGWVEAQHVTAQDTLYVAALPCPYCESLAPIRGTNVYCSPNCGSKNSAKEMWGREDVRKSISSKASEQLKREFSSGVRTKQQTAEARQKAFDKYGPGGYLAFNPEVISYGMPTSRTSIEKWVSSALTEAGKTFVEQFRVGSRKIDFYLPEDKLFIEADGEWWHQDKEAELRRDIEILTKYPDHKITHILFPIDASKPLVRQTRDLLSLNHEGQYALLPVSVVSVTTSKMKSPRRLWNLAVEEDNSFIANGLVVHNCDMLAGLDPSYLPAGTDYESLLSDIVGSL